MLVIRYQRQGRKNSAFFRIVLTESSKPIKSGFLKILGWYNPHTKKSSLKKEEIIDWLNKGAQASNSVSKLLKMNKIDHKNASFVPDAPKAKKKKEVKPKAPVTPPKDNQEAEKKPASEQRKDTDENKEVEIQPETAEGAKEETTEEEAAPTSGAVGVPTGSSDRSVGESVGKEKVEENLEEKKADE